MADSENLRRIREMNLTPEEMREALLFLSGYSPDGVSDALDEIEHWRKQKAQTGGEVAGG